MPRTDVTKTIRCSFCGKPQSEVNRLIAGNGSYICDECVRLCMGIIDENYAALCPWTKIQESGNVMSTEATDLAVNLWENEATQEHRKKQKASRKKKQE